MFKTPVDIKGIVALIISLTFGIILITITIGAEISGRAIQPAGINLLSTICGALIGVLSSYIGGKVADKPTDAK